MTLFLLFKILTHKMILVLHECIAQCVTMQNILKTPFVASSHAVTNTISRYGNQLMLASLCLKAKQNSFLVMPEECGTAVPK